MKLRKYPKLWNLWLTACLEMNNTQDVCGEILTQDILQKDMAILCSPNMNSTGSALLLGQLFNGLGTLWETLHTIP